MGASTGPGLPRRCCLHGPQSLRHNVCLHSCTHSWMTSTTTAWAALVAPTRLMASFRRLYHLPVTKRNCQQPPPLGWRCRHLRCRPGSATPAVQLPAPLCCAADRVSESHPVQPSHHHSSLPALACAGAGSGLRGPPSRELYLISSER